VTPGRGHRRAARAAAGAALVVLVVGCAAPPPAEGPPPFRIAVGPDPEAALLARTAGVLAQEAGVPVALLELAEVRSERQAVELGDADLYVGYSGQAWLEVLGRADPPVDPTAGLATVASADRERGLVWLLPGDGTGLEAPPANATFALFVAGPPAVDADLRTLSGLALRLGERPDAPLCVDEGFAARADGLGALLAAYGVRRDRPFLAADPERAVAGVVARDCLAGLSHATDGRAWAAGLQPLVDDLRFFFALVPVPVVRADALSEHPRLRASLAPLGRLSTAALGRANARVATGEGIAGVAADLAVALRDGAAGSGPGR
jgi:osmoprotectant transport system substrate-binding protein